MNRKCTIFISAIVLLELLATSSAFSCYECSELGQACFTVTAQMLKDCGGDVNVCSKSYSKVGTVESVTRRCGRFGGRPELGDDSCLERELQGVKTTICNCNKDSCNHAHGMAKISLGLNGLWVVVAVIFRLLIS